MEIGQQYRVRLIHVVSAAELYGFKLDDVSNLKHVNDRLNDIYNNEKYKMIKNYYLKPSVGSRRVCKTSRGYWRRVVVERVLRETQEAFVRQLDYGLSHLVSLNELLPYESFYCHKVRALAFRFTACQRTIDNIPKETFLNVFAPDRPAMEYKEVTVYVMRILRTPEPSNIGHFRKMYEVLFLDFEKMAPTNRPILMPPSPPAESNVAAAASAGRGQPVKFLASRDVTASPKKLQRRNRSLSCGARRNSNLVVYKSSKKLPESVVARYKSTEKLSDNAEASVAPKDDDDKNAQRNSASASGENSGNRSYRQPINAAPLRSILKKPPPFREVWFPRYVPKS